MHVDKYAATHAIMRWRDELLQSRPADRSATCHGSCAHMPSHASQLPSALLGWPQSRITNRLRLTKTVSLIAVMTINAIWRSKATIQLGRHPGSTARPLVVISCSSPVLIGSSCRADNTLRALPARLQLRLNLPLTKGRCRLQGTA